MRTWRALVDHLASATTACLTSEERQRLLGEKIDDANARTDACERARGRTPAPHADVVGPRQMFEPETDYEGQAIRSFELEPASRDACRAACVDEPRCKAFVLLRAGVFGPKAICYLKPIVGRRRYTPTASPARSADLC